MPLYLLYPKDFFKPLSTLEYLTLIGMKKKIITGLIGIVVIMQLLRPTRNVSDQISENEISKHYQIPEELHAILKKSCYDCHSNNTQYPWYVNIQPIGWWLQSHVNDGKRHLNFSEFGSYPEKKAKHKFEEMEDAMTNGWMPLESYLLIHQEAKLTPEQYKSMAQWAGALK